MGYWKSKPNTYNEFNFIEIPEGDHRVQIHNVVVERFSNHKKCFEITLKVSGYHGKLWYYLWHNPENFDTSTKRFFSFFNSFNIQDHDLDNYKNWIGKSGAVRVVTDDEVTDSSCDYKYAIRVSLCLNGPQRDKLPPWREPTKELYSPHKETSCDSSDDLPF